MYYKQLCRKCQVGFNPYRVESILCKVYLTTSFFFLKWRITCIRCKCNKWFFHSLQCLRAALRPAAAARRSRGTSTWRGLTARTCVVAARAWGCPATPPTASNTSSEHPPPPSRLYFYMSGITCRPDDTNTCARHRLEVASSNKFQEIGLFSCQRVDESLPWWFYLKRLL